MHRLRLVTPGPGLATIHWESHATMRCQSYCHCSQSDLAEMQSEPTFIAAHLNKHLAALCNGAVQLQSPVAHGTACNEFSNGGRLPLHAMQEIKVETNHIRTQLFKTLHSPSQPISASLPNHAATAVSSTAQGWQRGLCCAGTRPSSSSSSKTLNRELAGALQQ